MTGLVPKYHVLAHFVILVPREIPASNNPGLTSKKRARASNQASQSDPKLANKCASKKIDDTAKGDLGIEQHDYQNSIWRLW